MPIQMDIHLSMYDLCGTSYPLQPSPWPPIILASLIYLAPSLIPWRLGSLAACVIIMVLIGVMAGEAFVWYVQDVCYPPYEQSEARQLTVVATLSLAVVSYFQIVASQRPFAWRRSIQAVMLIKQYAMAVAPAFILLLWRMA